MIYLQATIATGTSIDDAATELCDLALRAGVAVQASFQEILLTAHRDSSPVELVAEYGRRRSDISAEPQTVDSLPICSPKRAVDIGTSLKVNKTRHIIDLVHPMPYQTIGLEVVLICRIGDDEYASSVARYEINVRPGGVVIDTKEGPQDNSKQAAVFLLGQLLTMADRGNHLQILLTPTATGTGVGSVPEVDADITVRP